MMTPKQLAGLGKQLGAFLALFKDCFQGADLAGRLCEGPALGPAPQNGRSDRPAIRQGAAHVTTFPGIDQVG